MKTLIKLSGIVLCIFIYSNLFSQTKTETKTVKEYIAGLTSTEKGVNSKSREMLIKLHDQGNKEVATELMKLLESNDQNSQKESAYILGKIKYEGALQRLMELVEKSTDKDVRINSIGALGRLNNTAAIPVLLKAIQDPVSSGVRKYSAEAIGKMGGNAVSAGPKLVEIYNTAQADVQDDIIWALGEINYKEATKGL